MTVAVIFIECAQIKLGKYQNHVVDAHLQSTSDVLAPCKSIRNRLCKHTKIQNVLLKLLLTLAKCLKRILISKKCANISGVGPYGQARVLPSGPDISTAQMDRRNIRKAGMEGEQESQNNRRQRRKKTTKKH